MSTEIKIHSNYRKALVVLEVLLSNNPKNIEVVNQTYQSYLIIYGDDYAWQFLTEHIQKFGLNDYTVQIRNKFQQIVNVIERDMHSYQENEYLYSKLRKLGKLLLDAEARLYKDLLQGKDFSVFKSVYPIKVSNEVDNVQ